MAIVIDASGAVMGRLASHVAKRLLEGEEIVLVNAEKAVITGTRDNILANYTQKRERGTPRFGPYFPRVPHLILKRAVRGMMPYQTPRGLAAYRRLRCEIGVPSAYLKMTIVKVPQFAKPGVQSMSIAQLSKDLGAKVRAQRTAPSGTAAAPAKPAKAPKVPKAKEAKA
jgi:large subunit ribosomal protein L13